jgi:hypothetical protein
MQSKLAPKAHPERKAAGFSGQELKDYVNIEIMKPILVQGGHSRDAKKGLGI